MAEELKEDIVILKALTFQVYKQVIESRIAEFVPALVVDLSDATIIYITPQIVTLFGYADKEMIGKNFSFLMPERFRKIHDEHFAKYASNPKQRQMGDENMKLYGITKIGREFNIEIGLYPTTIVGREFVVATILALRK